MLSNAMPYLLILFIITGVVNTIFLSVTDYLLNGSTYDLIREGYPKSYNLKIIQTVFNPFLTLDIFYSIIRNLIVYRFVNKPVDDRENKEIISDHFKNRIL